MRSKNISKLEDVAYLAGRIGWKGLTAKEYTKEGPLFLSVHGLNYGDYVNFRDAFHISQERYDESPEIMLQEEDILLCKDGAGIGKLGIIDHLPASASINSSLLIIRALKGVFPKYLYYSLCSPLFQSIVQERIDGATTPHLYQREIKILEIPLPPLEEQKRIVAILDKAFAGIDQAIANAEQNIENALDLFESYRKNIFTPKSKGWMEIKLGEACTLQRGFDLPKRLRKTGDFPLVSSSGVIDSHIVAKVVGPCVATGRSGSIGNVFYLEDDFWPLNTVLYIKDFHGNDPEFIYHLLKVFNLKRFTSGAGVPTLNRNHVHDELVSIPSDADEQRNIVADLKSLIIQTDLLKSHTKQKLAALKELKQSLLQKAFAGELNSDMREVA